jgi:hypothetical protein
MMDTPQTSGRRRDAPRSRMRSVVLLCLYWSASGTGLGLLSVTSYVAVRSTIFAVMRQPATGMAGAIVAVLMFFFMAATVATVVVLPVGFATTYAYAIAARAGFFDDSSRRGLVTVALSVGGLGTVLFAWATGVELSDASAESITTLLGLWLAIAFGWVGPRLWVRRLRAGRFSGPDSHG